MEDHASTDGEKPAEAHIRRVVDVVESDLAVTVPSPDTDLLAAGLLDSLALVTVMVSLEDEFGVTFPRDEFSPEMFRTPWRMASRIAELTRSPRHRTTVGNG